MKYTFGTIARLVCCLLVCGCSLLQDGSISRAGRKFDKAFWEQEQNPEIASADGLEIANPPAKTIRFDGREVVLGTADVTQVAADEFGKQLSSLLDKGKFFTATNLVAKNPDTAEKILWERWATDPDTVPVRFIAKVVSHGIVHGASWNAMLDGAKKNRVAARSYQSARNSLTKKLRSETPSNDEVQRLRSAAQKIQQPLAMIDTLHLMAVGELAAGRHAWAKSLLLQAIEVAEKHQDEARVANLWLMVAMNSSRSGDSTLAATGWKNAVARHCQALVASKRPLDVAFWSRADRQRPGNVAWPGATKRALLEFAKPVGCRFSDESPSELVIWSAVGNAQLDDGDPQLALLNFKKAETFASGEDAMWLRIAQSECLAALGQSHAAAALLSEPLASHNPAISAASNAALGSAKLQAGTFQQGAQLLNKALVDSSNLEWPARSKAEADLALAMLVIGETSTGLKSLHAVQRKFEIQGKTSSLLQSLENELRLLEHEGKTDAANSVRQRIRQIEGHRAKSVTGANVSL